MVSALEILRKREYVSLLKDVAKIQNSLFLKHFDWRE